MSRAAALRAQSAALYRAITDLHRAGVEGAPLEALRVAARACDEELESITTASPSTLAARRQAGTLEHRLARSVAILDAAGKEVA